MIKGTKIARHTDYKATKAWLSCGQSVSKQKTGRYSDRLTDESTVSLEFSPYRGVYSESGVLS